jgi:hypothetical protein
MSSNKCIMDEFGRDLSLKPKAYDFKSLFGNMLDRFKGMSWADMCVLIEDEEEEEKKIAERAELRKTHDERKKLYAQGLYELEDGEELEFPESN